MLDQCIKWDGFNDEWVTRMDSERLVFVFSFSCDSIKVIDVN